MMYRQPHIHITASTIQFHTRTEMYVAYEIRPDDRIHVKCVVAQSRAEAVRKVLDRVESSLVANTVVRGMAYTEEVARDDAARAVMAGRCFVVHDCQAIES